MKVLITTLNSKFIHSSLAVRYLYSRVESLKQRQIEVSWEEFTINNSEEYIFNEIVAGEYQVVCFSCYIWNVEKTLNLCDKLEKALPTLKIVLGGPEVSYDAKKLLNEKTYIDYIVCGEGENVVPELINKIYKKEINQRCIVEGGIVDVDDIPFPSEENISPNKIIYYESTRGCPYKCSYCMSSIDKKVRPFPIERVKRELKFFLDKKVKQVKFLDRTFNWNEERSLEIFEYLIENDNGITNFHFEICAENMTNEIIDVLKKARNGLMQFEIGIQSTNDKTLESVDRFSNVQLLLSKVQELIQLRNCHIHVDLIVGLPYETLEIFKTSFDQVYNLGADALQLGFLKVLKGTKIRTEAETHEYIFDERAPYQVIRNKYMSAIDMIKLKRVEHVLDAYYNKGGFERSLEYLVGIFESSFEFYYAFGEFYFKEGYQKSSHKKEDNYRILNKFAESISAGEGVRDIIYEDMKSRLNFDAIKRFDKKGWNV